MKLNIEVQLLVSSWKLISYRTVNMGCNIGIGLDMNGSRFQRTLATPVNNAYSLALRLVTHAIFVLWASPISNHLVRMQLDGIFVPLTSRNCCVELFV